MDRLLGSEVTHHHIKSMPPELLGLHEPNSLHSMWYSKWTHAGGTVLWVLGCHCPQTHPNRVSCQPMRDMHFGLMPYRIVINQCNIVTTLIWPVAHPATLPAPLALARVAFLLTAPAATHKATSILALECALLVTDFAPVAPGPCRTNVCLANMGPTWVQIVAPPLAHRELMDHKLPVHVCHVCPPVQLVMAPPPTIAYPVSPTSTFIRPLVLIHAHSWCTAIMAYV